MLGDNNSVVLRCTMSNSVLKKKHNTMSWHSVREAIAGGMMKFVHIPSKMNCADILTKPLPGPQFRELVDPLLFRQPKEEQLVHNQFRGELCAGRSVDVKIGLECACKF